MTDTPTPIGPQVILCACGSKIGLTGICQLCLQSTCPQCSPEHGPGLCDQED